MTIEEFVKGMKVLLTIYNKEFDQDTIKVWYGFFKEVSLNDFMIAVKRIGEKETFFPSVARLKSEISTYTNPEFQLDVDEEWNEVRYCIRTYGPYKEEEAMKYLKPFTRKIVEGMDYQRLMSVPTAEMQYEYNRFKTAFMGYSKALSDASVVSTNVRTLTESKRMGQLTMSDDETLKLLGDNDECRL